jgi:hypothetical protein
MAAADAALQAAGAARLLPTSLASAADQVHAGAPAVIQAGTLDGWAAWRDGPSRWTLERLSARFPGRRFKVANRVGERGGRQPTRLCATLRSFAAYAATGASSADAHTPLYLFDSSFPGTTAGRDYDPADLGAVTGGESGDLLALLPPSQRPSYRWIIAGAAGSGSPWHIDPFGSSAWNASLSGGVKMWLFLPPHMDPPGEEPPGGFACIRPPS